MYMCFHLCLHFINFVYGHYLFYQIFQTTIHDFDILVIVLYDKLSVFFICQKSICLNFNLFQAQPLKSDLCLLIEFELHSVKAPQVSNYESDFNCRISLSLDSAFVQLLLCIRCSSVSQRSHRMDKNTYKTKNKGLPRFHQGTNIKVYF